VFPTDLDHAVVPPGPAARIAAAPHPAAPAVTVARPGAHISPGPGPAARSGRVISPSTPQPPQLGDEPPVYDDGVLRITRIPAAGPAPSPASSPGPSPGPGYALAGEIDESTVCGLAAKLAELAANLDEVHLDLGALAYSDLAGLRVIVQLAAGRRRMVLHRVPPHLRAVLAIVGWDTAPGLEFAS
jgi:ABC-type transporter Mla MlaB component